MPTEDQLIAGLHAADAAGNTADAQHFADQIKAMRASAPAQSSGGSFVDVAKGLGSGLLQNLNPFLGNSGPLQVNENDPQAAQLHLPQAETMESVPGSGYKPQTTAGQYAQRVGQFAPAALGGEASIPARVMARVIAPAAGSMAGGSMVDENAHPILHGAAEVGGALLGGGLAAGAGRGAKSVTQLASTIRNPLGEVSPDVADLAAKAKNLGVEIRPAQMSGNKFVTVADDEYSRLPYTGYGDSGPKISTEAQHAQFTRALGKTFGVDADALTPDVMAKARAGIGDMFKAGLKGVTLLPTPETEQALSTLGNHIADIAPALNDTDTVRLVRTLNKIKSTVADGMTGEQYQSMRQKGGLISGLSEDANPSVAGLGGTMREMLDDAFQQQAPPEQAGILGQARQFYRNFKTVEPLADKAPLGKVSPALLLGQVNKTYPNLETAGDIGDLGRIGQAFLKTPPNSTTAERSLALQLTTNPAGAAKMALQWPAQQTLGRVISSRLNAPQSKNAALAAALAKGGATTIVDPKAEAIAKALAAQGR